MFQIAKDIELVRFEKKLANGSNFKIDAPDDSKLMKAICLSIHHSILSQKKQLIIIPDNYDLATLAMEIKELGLLGHCLIINNTDSNKLEDISTLHKANIPVACLSIDSLNLFKEDYSALLHDLESDYSSLLDKTTFNASIADLVEIRNHGTSDRIVQEISALFDSHHLHDFKVLYSNIMNAGIHHHESHGLLNNTINPSYFIEGTFKDQDQLSENISKQILSAEGLIDQIDLLMQDQFESIHNTASDLLINTIQKVSIIKEQFLIEETISRPSKKSFFGRNQETKSPEATVKAEISELIKDLHQNEVLNKTIDFNLFKDVLDKNQLHKLTNYLKTVKIDESIIRSIISRTNISQIANDTNQRLVAIEDSLTMYQDDSILNEQIKTGGFTLIHKKQALKHDLIALKQIRLSFTSNPKLFEWLKNYYQLNNLEKSVVDVLFFNDHQQWSKLLQSAYIDLLLNKSRTLFSHLDSKRFESALRLERLIEEEEYKIARNNISAYRQKLKNEHQTNNKLFLETLKSSKTNVNSIQDLFLNHLPSLMDYYQTCIVTTSKYMSEPEQFQSKRDLVFNINPSIQVEENDCQVVSLGRVQKDPDTMMDDTQLFDRSDSLPLLLPYPSSIENGSKERLKRNISWARSLSTNIYALNSKYRIYQTKNLGIISFWSEHKDKVLQQLAGSHAIKEISFSGKNGMVETLLDETKQTVFLFQDGLINPKYPKLYHWQFYLIQLLKTANIACYNIWSSDYHKHGSYLIKSIAEEIALKPSTETVSKQNDSPELVTSENS